MIYLNVLGCKRVANRAKPSVLSVRVCVCVSVWEYPSTRAIKVCILAPNRAHLYNMYYTIRKWRQMKWKCHSNNCTKKSAEENYLCDFLEMRDPHNDRSCQIRTKDAVCCHFSTRLDWNLLFGWPVVILLIITSFLVVLFSRQPTTEFNSNVLVRLKRVTVSITDSLEDTHLSLAS